MGIYLYNLSSKSRKTTTGEEVYLLRFMWKHGSKGSSITYNSIPERYYAYEFKQAAEVFQFERGWNYWWDCSEERKKKVGHLILDGKNRFKLHRGELPLFYEEAYELVESEGRDSGTSSFGFKDPFIKSRGKHSDGTYWFELTEGSTDGPIVWAKYHSFPDSTEYDTKVKFVATLLKELYEEAERRQLQKAG